jgi:hypothetical protein
MFPEAESTLNNHHNGEAISLSSGPKADNDLSGDPLSQHL